MWEKSMIFSSPPSPNGENCIGNGQNKDIECMCDECDHFLECYPEWDSKK